MELDGFLQRIIDEHVGRSLEEVIDAEKMCRWTDGQRAQEEAEKIVAQMIESAINSSEHNKEAKDGG